MKREGAEHGGRRLCRRPGRSQMAEAWDRRPV